MNGCDRMDIISEILETDKLADEKIKKAHEKQAALEKQTDEQIERFRLDAQDKTEAYRKKTESRTKSEADGQIARITKDEQEKIAKIDELYAAKHKKWEKVICEKVLSGD